MPLYLTPKKEPERNQSPGASVEISKLSRQFRERAISAKTDLVLDHIDLSIRPGEFVSFLGPSGCGKSTLLRLIAGLDQPSAGRLTVEPGVDLSVKFPTRKSFRGFVFQEAQLLPWLNVLDNAALPLELMKQSNAKDQAHEVLRRMGLGDALTKFPNQLSGGMKMRVSIARALVSEPSLLLLDEPFAALDENTRFRLQEELRSLWQRLKMTVIFVTHSISEAVFLSDRAIVFSKRPARIVVDHPVQLPTERNEALRTRPEILGEIAQVTAAFRRGDPL